MGDSTATPITPTLHRRNSIAAVTPSKFSREATPPPLRTTSLDLASLKSPFTSSAYTSLRDMLPSPYAAVNSPTAASAASSGYEISIRNHLVKQAAWAYLQPMSSASPASSSSSVPRFLRRLCHPPCSAKPLVTCFSFLYNHLVSGVASIFHRILHTLRGQVTT
ncbi:uncharacterized protein LOC130730795 [Lotus japonicus]|uniref:uncharacterized protein LOC130730795 n=1 Tax=Lotus japonicus TaxID=34305 RepID=UPI00258949A4|nr:uncharacterized protein LOC130730795 [Lotus japonicus]